MPGRRASRLALVIVPAIALAACEPLVRAGQQLDILLVYETGVGSQTTKSFALPHGRYTLFSYDDPAGCVRSLGLVDSHGHEVASDGAIRGGAIPPGASAQQMLPSFVQREVQAGTYHLVARTGDRSCAWMAQGILNSMLDLLGSPPDPVKPPVANPASALQTAQGKGEGDFEISQPGLYHAKWTVTFPATNPTCAYDLSVVANDGRQEHLGDSRQGFTSGGAASVGSDGPLFLGAGRWRTVASGTCPWTLSITPWIGSLGGGTQGFAKS